MAEFTADAVLDAALAKLATSTRMVITSAQPANFAGIAAVALADVTMTGGDYVNSDNVTGGGRKVTVAAKSAVPVDATGTATHLCLDDGTTLLHVTTTTSQGLTTGSTVNIPAWNIAFQDPV